MAKGHVLAVVGAQYGSEGKGVIVNRIADRYDTHVRVGSPNAGHTFYWQDKKWVMQQVPCGWTNPNAMLVLGRGALIDIDILKREIAMIETVFPDIRSRLVVDPKAGVLSPWHHAAEGGVDGEIHKRIGSTGEGVGAARVARANRDPANFRHFGDVAEAEGLADLLMNETPAWLQRRLQSGNVLIEGTQGAGLSLIHGPWPYATSTDTNAAQMAADVGLPPRLISKVLLVARTFPIRVAGNSGPLKNEVSWETMSDLVGATVEERTTVTKKVRRVGLWDDDLLDNAIILNGPSSLAVSFLDYLFPGDTGVKTLEDLSDAAKEFIFKLESRFRLRVSLIGTGGPNCEVIVTGEDV